MHSYLRWTLLSFGFVLVMPAAVLAQQPDTLATPFYRAARQLHLTAGADTTTALNSEVESSLLTFTTIQPALSRVAGVQVTPYSGGPGTMIVVRIRGAASLAANAQPLYVVDGIPALQGPLRQELNSSQSNLYGNDPRDFNPLLSLPPEDVEQIRVLKGPLETARYGAQGQNGVIEITTRRGQLGQPLRVHYSGAGGVQQARYRYNLLSAREFAEVANEAAINQGGGPEFTPAQIATLGTGTDWQREILRTAAVQQHHLSLEGGGNTTRGHLGVDYLRQTGIMVNSNLSRYSLMGNLEQRVGQRLRVEVGGGLSQISGRQPDPNVTLNMLLARPDQPARDAQGEPVETPGFFFNPLREALQRYEDTEERRLIGHVTLDYELVEGVHAELRAGYESTRLELASNQASYFSLPGGRVLERRSSFDKLTLHPVLRFEHTLGERHIIAARLEGWQQDYQDKTAYKTFAAGQPDGGSGSSSANQALLSYQGQGSYQFDRRYEAQVSLRRDGSSVRAFAQRWEMLPAVQLNWHAKQESFLRDKSQLSRLDVWASWGKTSNSGSIYSQNYGGQQVLGVITSLPQNELTTQQEAGLRLGLWQDQLDLTVTAYQRRTEVGFQTVVLTGPITGSPSEQMLAQLRTRGLELTVASAWSAGAVRGTTTVTASLQAQQVDSEFMFRTSNGQRFGMGLPLSSFYGLHYLGADAATGEPRYQDKDGSWSSNGLDAEGLGSGLPRQLLSVSQQLGLRRFTLNAQLDGLFGYQVDNYSLQFLDVAYGSLNNSNRVRDRWQPNNRNTDVPAAGTRLQPLSTYTLQSGNHLRLTALTLSFRAWEKAARRVDVWVGGQNLLVISKYRGFDPNVSSGGSDAKSAGLDAGAYPVARTVSVGVRTTL